MIRAIISNVKTPNRARIAKSSQEWKYPFPGLGSLSGSAAWIERMITLAIMRRRMMGSVTLQSQSDHRSRTYGWRIMLSIVLRTTLFGPNSPKVLPLKRSGGMASGLALAEGVSTICMLSVRFKSSILSPSIPSSSGSLDRPSSLSLPIILTTLTLARRNFRVTERIVGFLVTLAASRLCGEERGRPESSYGFRWDVEYGKLEGPGESHR